MAGAQSAVSGFYARYSYDAAGVSPQFGAAIDLSGLSLTSTADAAAACNLDSTCWGFVQQGPGSTLVLMSGSQAVNIRTLINTSKASDDGTTDSSLLLQL